MQRTVKILQVTPLKLCEISNAMTLTTSGQHTWAQAAARLQPITCRLPCHT